MKKYWLYIESFVFIFPAQDEALFYNTLSGNHFKIRNNGHTKKIITTLLNPLEMYCVELSSADLIEEEIKELISLLRDNYMGEVVDQDAVEKKPVNIFPKLKIMNSIEHLSWDNNSGSNVLSYLRELTVQITDSCEFNCKYCNVINKQYVACCSENKNHLSIQVLRDILSSVYHSSMQTLRLKGGNIFSYKHYEELMDVLKLYPKYSYQFVCSYLHINDSAYTYLEQLAELSSSNNIHIILQIGPNLDTEKLQQAQELLQKLNLSFKCEFFVTSHRQYERVEQLCNGLEGIEYEILPLILPQSRFIKDILIDEKALFYQVHSKKAIFRRQTLNNNDFGVLHINADGSVYANVNMPKLGNIKNASIPELIHKECVKGKSWFRIRNHQPCKNCVYQWLCPSPSNYELVLDKENLCNIK